MATKARLAILFADLAGSRGLYQGLGDVRASVVVAQCVHVMSRTVRETGGTVVRIVGDEVMATFPSADAAVSAAIGMQDGVGALIAAPGTRLALRVGMHLGQVLVASSEIYGDAVNIAARIVGHAKAGEILLTGEAAAAVAEGLHPAARHIGWINIKGQTEPIEICEIVWRVEDATMMTVGPRQWRVDQPADQPLMAFRLCGDRHFLSRHHAILTFGREDRNDVVVLGSKVSRQHAFTELRNGRVMLIDQSANGTFIAPDGSPPFRLHRDSVELTGAGMIGFGEEPGGEGPGVVRYEACRVTV